MSHDEHSKQVVTEHRTPEEVAADELARCRAALREEEVRGDALAERVVALTQDRDEAWRQCHAAHAEYALARQTIEREREDREQWQALAEGNARAEERYRVAMERRGRDLREARDVLRRIAEAATAVNWTD